MNYKEQTNEVKQIIIDLATEAQYGNPEYTNLNEIDYKFWEDCSHEESVIILAQKLAKLNEKITELQKNSTIETNRHYPEIMNNCVKAEFRAFSFGNIKGIKKYVTIEPILDFDLIEMVNIIQECEPYQVNIGADSGNNHLPEPSKEKLLQLIKELEKFTVIHSKRNLNRLLV